MVLKWHGEVSGTGRCPLEIIHSIWGMVHRFVEALEFWGLPPLIPLLQCVNRLGFEICSVNSCQSEQGSLVTLSKLAKMLCTGHREFGTNRWKFLSKTKHFIFRLCRNCEFMMCILIVDHQFNRMYPWCSWECMLPGRCSPGKRCHTFWNRNIVLLPILLGKVSCVPKHTLYELYGVKSWEGLA